MRQSEFGDLSSDGFRSFNVVSISGDNLTLKSVNSTDCASGFVVNQLDVDI